MAHRKAGGSTRNLRDSNPQYLGVKLADGEIAKPGAIIIRQRGTFVVAGENTRLGKDHTIYSVADGLVKFGSKRKNKFDGSHKKRKTVSVIPSSFPKND